MKIGVNNNADNGNEFVTFAESPTKTQQGGLRVQPRSVLPKMFATGESRCPVALFKSRLSMRPEDLRPRHTMRHVAATGRSVAATGRLVCTASATSRCDKTFVLG